MFQGLSSYGYSSVLQREQLVSQLLTRLQGVQLGDAGYEELLDSTVHSLQYHKFLDTNPSEVEDLYARLQDRLGEFAQFEKQRALGLLQRRLVSLDLPSAQYDFQHRLLAFLYSAAHAPLDSQYEGGILVDRLQHEAQSAIQAQPTYLSDSTPSGSWASGSQQLQPSGSEGDSLSDWSDGNGEGEVTSRLAAAEATNGDGLLSGLAGLAVEGSSSAPCDLPGGAPPTPGRLSDSAAESSQAHPSEPAAGLRAAVLDRRRQLAPLVPPPRESPYRRDSLAVWLAARRSGGHPARLLNPQLCFTQKELLQQVLHLLQGLSQPGPAFTLDPVRGIYTVTPGLHMHNSSPASTRALLQRFAELGTALRRVQEFCAEILAPGAGICTMTSNGVGGVEEQADSELLQQLPTAAAFAAALDAQLKALQKQVIPLELEVRSGALTLLQLQHHLEKLRRSALALQAIARQCIWRNSAAATAAGLLDAVDSMVQEQLLLASSEGGALAAMGIEILTATFRPYLDRLHAWVQSGDFSTDACGELFIVADPSIQPTSSKFWRSAYSLRRVSDGTPIAPSFLLPLADSLLAAGKSAVLLRAAAAQEGSCSAGASAALPHAALGPATRDACTAATTRTALFQPGWQAAGNLQSRLMGTQSSRQPVRMPTSGQRPSKTGEQRQQEQQDQGSRTVHQQPEQQQQQPRPFPSPTKQRLTAISALGFDIATAVTPRASGRPASAGLTPGPLSPQGLAVEEPASPAEEAAVPSVQPLHTVFLGNLQQLLKAPAGQAKPQQQQQQQRQQGSLDCRKPPFAENLDGQEHLSKEGAARGPGSPPHPTSSTPDIAEAAGAASTDDEEDWLERVAATSRSSPTLGINPAEDLPSLQPLPRSALQLLAPEATIVAKELPPWPTHPTVAAATDAAAYANGSEHSYGTQIEELLPRQRAQQGPGELQGASFADRMQLATQQRVQQTSRDGPLLNRLPALLQPPAALGQPLPSPGASSGNELLSPQPTGGPDFDSQGWTQWYRRVHTALSSQMLAVDMGLGNGALTTPKVVTGAGALSELGFSLTTRQGVWAGKAKWLPKDHSSELGPQPSSADAVSAARCTHAPPLESLLQEALLGPLEQQARRMEAALTSSLLHRWGLRQQLLTLREVFLLGSGLMTAFLESLFLSISTRSGLAAVTALDLNNALHQCFLAAGRRDLLDVTVDILPGPTTTAAAQQQQQQHQVTGPVGTSAVASASAASAGTAGLAPGMPTVQALSRLRLSMERGWPLCLVASEDVVQQYSAILVLLVQVRWVQRSLASLQRTKWKGGTASAAPHRMRPAAAAPPPPSGEQPPAQQTAASGLVSAPIAAGTTAHGAAAPAMTAERTLEQGKMQEGRRQASSEQQRLKGRDGVLQQMAHLADALGQYAGERLLAAWHWLMEALPGCRSLDEIQRCHSKYMTAAIRHCLLGQDAITRLLHDALLRLLDCALQYCWLSAQLAKVSAAAAAAASEGPLHSGALASARQRESSLQAQLSGVRREFGSRQRLVMKVLASRAGEVGTQGAETRQLLAALDYSGYFQSLAS